MLGSGSFGKVYIGHHKKVGNKIPNSTLLFNRDKTSDKINKERGETGPFKLRVVFGNDNSERLRPSEFSQTIRGLPGQQVLLHGVGTLQGRGTLRQD